MENNEKLADVKNILGKYEKRYRASAKWWRVSYRVLLVTSALLSASAAIVGKLDIYTIDASGDITSILAGLAAVFTTLIATLDFETNWRINRRSRYAVDLVALEAEKTDADPDKLLDALREIVSQRNEGLGKQE